MTDPHSLLAAYDGQLRQIIPTPPLPGHRYDRIGPLLRVSGGHEGFIDTQQDLGVTGAALDQLILEQRDYFASRGESVEWKTREHDKPSDLPQRLRAAGFVPEDRETVVVGVAETMRRTVPLPESVTLREVRDRGDLERIAAMETEVWERDFAWLADDLEGRIQNAPEQIVVIVAEANDQMVSAAWLLFRADCDFAGLWGGSTLENWRGKGIYHALVAHRAHTAAERGVRYLQVDASDESLPILLRLGFEAITTTTPYVWTPPGGQTEDARFREV